MPRCSARPSICSAARSAGARLEEGEGVLRCGEGHSFDIARQGYVNLVPGPGDSAEMVEAREAFLAAGHSAASSEALAEEAAGGEAPGRVVDLGAGTGHYLARVLDALPERIGLALDCIRTPPSAAPPEPTRARPRSAPTPGATCRCATTPPR